MADKVFVLCHAVLCRVVSGQLDSLDREKSRSSTDFNVKNEWMSGLLSIELILLICKSTRQIGLGVSKQSILVIQKVGTYLKLVSLVWTTR